MSANETGDLRFLIGRLKEAARKLDTLLDAPQPHSNKWWLGLDQYLHEVKEYRLLLADYRQERLKNGE